MGRTHRMANHASSKSWNANHQKASQWGSNGNIQQEDLLHIHDRHHQSLVPTCLSYSPQLILLSDITNQSLCFLSHFPHPSLFLGAIGSWMSERYSDLTHSKLNSWSALQNKKQPVLSSTSLYPWKYYSLKRVLVSYTVILMASMLSLHRWE